MGLVLEAGQGENRGLGEAGAGWLGQGQHRVYQPLGPPPEHCLLQGLQVALTSVQGPAGEVNTHGVDADIVWRGEERGLGSIRQTGQLEGLASLPCPGSLLTNVVGLVKDHHSLAGQLLGHQVGNLGVQEVVVAVNHHVGMQDLGGRGGQCYPRLTATSTRPQQHIPPSQVHRG